LLALAACDSQGTDATAASTAESPPVALPDLSDAAKAEDDPAHYAWDLFVAMSWPAVEGQRGVPDPDARFGTGTPTWATWKHAHEVFLPLGADPVPWSVYHEDHAGDFKGNTRLASGFVLGSSFGGPTVSEGVQDTKGRPVYGEIYLNRPQFEYVVENNLYHVGGQVEMVKAGTRQLDLPRQAIGLKVTYRILDEGVDDFSRFFTLKGLIELDGEEHEVTFGLNSLNIISNVLPDGFFTAFEHVDNPTATLAGLAPTLLLDVRVPEDVSKVNEQMHHVLAGSPGQYYRCNGYQTEYVDADGKPTYLANTQQETNIMETSSCITCHSGYASIGLVDGVPTRMDTLSRSTTGLGDPPAGYLGAPDLDFFESHTFMRTAFMWVLLEANYKDPDKAQPDFMTIPEIEAALSK